MTNHELPIPELAQLEMLAQVDELVARGAKRFALLTGGKDYAPSYQMRDGLRSAVKRHKLSWDAEAVFYSDQDVPMAVREFLDQHNDVDGLLVERGCYVHFLGWLLGKRSRPYVGVLSPELDLGEMPEGFVQAGFEGDLYELTVERLFASRSGSKGKGVLLQPVLGP